MPDLDPTFGNQLQHITIIVSMLSGRETGYLRVRRTRRELLPRVGLTFDLAIIASVNGHFTRKPHHRRLLIKVPAAHWGFVNPRAEYSERSTFGSERGMAGYGHPAMMNRALSCSTREDSFDACQVFVRGI